MRLSVGTITLVCCSTILTAQDYEGRRVVEVQYQPADVLDPADLKRVTTVKAGSPLRPEDVSEGIDRLFATG